MNKLIIIIIASSFVVVIQVISRLSCKQKKKTQVLNSNYICLPRSILYVGISGTVLFLALAFFFLLASPSLIANYKEEMRLPNFIILFSISMGYGYFVLLQLNWQIVIRTEEFTYRNILGRKNTYKYNEIEIKQLSRCTRFYKSGKHIVGISYLLENWDALEKAIQTYNKNISKKTKS